MRALLVPSAVLVPQDMRKTFGDLPTALFPLGDRTMIEHIYNKYKNAVDKVYVVVYEKSLLIEDYIALKKLPIELIELDKLADLGYTVFFGLQYIFAHNHKVEYVYLNFADSLLDDPLPYDGCDIVYFSQNSTANVWTYFKACSGKFINILDKAELELDIGRAANFHNVFVGVFGFKHIGALLDVWSKATNCLAASTDSFYKAIFMYSQLYSFVMIETGNWFDVGHSENYLKAKTSVAARVFNTIEIDEKRGILKKTSHNKEKLVNEIRWYLRLPNKLQYLLPRIYDYSLDLNHPYVSMEYYGYHTLHDSLMYGNLSLVKWQNIFQKLLFVLEDMETFQVKNTENVFQASLEDIYVRKTVQRLESLRQDSNFVDLFLQPIVINGTSYLSLNEYLQRLPTLMQSIVIDSFEGNFNIIHGDLCFANILIEDTYNFIRVIDPRGKFGSYDIYGDGRYELAKLMHTLEGKYDFIIEDMFSLQKQGNYIEYHVSKKIDNILAVFMDVFSAKLHNIQAIRLIEAGLFLSMIPLHSDHRDRQYAMLATGILLLDKIMKQNGVGKFR